MEKQAHILVPNKDQENPSSRCQTSLRISGAIEEDKTMVRKKID